MHYCAYCGAEKGTGTGTCPAYLMGGPHHFVVGSKTMACKYDNVHPGGRGSSCHGKVMGGRHEFVRSKQV